MKCRGFFARFSKQILKILFGQNLDNFGFVLCVQDLSSLLCALEKKRNFCQELKVRSSLVDRRKRHDENAARFLIKRVKRDWIVRNTNTRNQVSDSVCFSVRNCNAVLHTSRHLSLAIQHTFARYSFVSYFSSLDKDIQHLIDNLFFCFTFEMKFHSIRC